jgi:hypothetical protein
MIDPHHECWWTGQRLTEIAVSGSGLAGAGVSLRVLLHAFTGQDLIWYARVYGDQEDNVLLAALDPATAASLERPPSSSLPSLSAAPEPLGLEVYELSDEVALRLGVKCDGSRALVEQHDGIRHNVYVHDDCFFLIEPLAEVLLKEVIHCVLRQHSFYLNLKVDWSGVLDPLGEILTRAKTIRLKSGPERKRLIVSWEHDTPSFWEQIFRRRTSSEIRIAGGKACFADDSERRSNRGRRT